MNFWYQHNLISKLQAWLLLPFSLIFALITFIRRTLYALRILPTFSSPVPVIVVGNLSVGGNGKTPVTIWLCDRISRLGLKVGIISRGYGSNSSFYPRLVNCNDSANEVGDEPLLLRQRTGVPVCIGDDRQQAIELLLQQHPVDVIISDDGLQHYALQRAVEIVVMDGERKFGNGWLMPAGPLREPISRLKSVDFVIVNGKNSDPAYSQLNLTAKYAINLASGEKSPLEQWQNISVQALAGIGNPARFFNMLQKLNFNLIQTKSFADHHQLKPTDLKHFNHDIPLFMTEKDAVKCRAFAQSNWWYIPVESEISGDLADNFSRLLDKIKPKSIG